jgi:imidazoleglycerol phosphate synthase glutamine amidotransferase subunit HisH
MRVAAGLLYIRKHTYSALSFRSYIAYQFHDEKVNDSGQAIEEATAESSEKIGLIEQLLRELP